jgi:hypothetical protein
MQNSQFSLLDTLKLLLRLRIHVIRRIRGEGFYCKVHSNAAKASSIYSRVAEIGRLSE